MAARPGRSATDPIELDPPPRVEQNRIPIVLSSDDDEAPMIPRRRLTTRKRAPASTPKTGPSSGKTFGSNQYPTPQRPLLPANAPSVESTPLQLSNTLGSFKINSGLQVKTSPQSYGKSNITVSQSFGAEVVHNSLSESDMGYEDDEPRQESPQMPSKQLTHAQSSPHGSRSGSINSSSPLLVRLAQQRSKRNPSPPKLATPQEQSQEESTLQSHGSNDEADEDAQSVMSKLEAALIGFHTTMHNDHAATVKWLLYDARTAVEDREPLFMDKVSPFASMEPVHVTSSTLLPEDSRTLKIDFYYNKKNRSRSRVRVISIPIADLAPRVPIYYSYTAVKRNILSGNDEKLRFIPFLGDIEESAKKKATFRKFMVEMEHMYSLKRSESGRKPERLAQIRSYLSHWLKELDLGIGHKELITYFLEEDSDDIELTPRQVKALQATFEVPLSRNNIETCRKLIKAFEGVFQYSLKDVIFLDEQLKELGELPKKSNNDTPVKDVKMLGTDEVALENSPDCLGTYGSLLCLICGAVCCQTHGDYQQSPRHDSGNDSDTSDEEGGNLEYSYNFRPVLMRYDDLLRKQDVREAEKAPDLDLQDLQEAPCSDKCYRTFDYSGLSYELSPEDMAQIRSMVNSLRGKKNRPCDISFILNLDCWQVENEINMSEPRAIEIDPPGKRPKGPLWYDNKRKTLKENWRDVTKAYQHEERVQANPCAHEGPCLDSCPCNNLNILCESFCGCSDDCPRRWTGCSCHAAGMLCTSDVCICIQMNRECGPQCVSCGAIQRINPAHKHYDELFQTGCQNVPLQRGVPRKVVLGESQLAGFGLYVAEPVRKGQFLIEYAGEVISNDEAERRGLMYDRQFLSFLFDLNSEWVIDAARLGNNSRFINHADNEKDGLNCEAKIVLVNGEHRIKFVALRDLKVGEELLFNYGKKFAEKHGLSKKLPKAREGKRGVVVGEEALAALDGLNPANRVTRGKMTAIRGGHGGTRGRKARKTAPLRELLEEVTQAAVQEEEGEVQEDDDGDGDEDADEDEDEDEDEIVDMVSRRKRKITRPARYSR